MLKNEKGQALITVLLVALIFSVLGLTIVAASINSNQRTGFRTDDIEITAEATREMNEAIAAFTKEARSITLSEQDLISGTLDKKFDLIKNELISNNLQIEDVTTEKHRIDKSKYFTRIFKFSYTLENDDGVEFAKKISRTIYLAPTPSFLKYALGSGPEGVVELNGASEIKGELFAGDLSTKDIAYFTDANTIKNNKESSEANTLLPRISLGNVYLKGELNGLVTFPSTKEELNQYFDEESKMTLTKDTSEFIDVDVGNTVAQLFNNISPGFSEEMFQTNAGINQAIYQLLSPCKSAILQSLNTTPLSGVCSNSIYLMEDRIDFNPNKLIDTNLPLTYVYTGLEKSNVENDFLVEDPNSETHYPLYIVSDLKLHDESWLIVHGDLWIKPKSNEPITIQGNIIVTGDLRIQGNQLDDNNVEETEEDDNVMVDSTIYVLGETKVSNTNITGFEDKQLVLISQGNLEITRINEFKDIKDLITPLDAIFYTHKEAELYGVGSLFSINGGLFAKDKLTINAIRQDNVMKNVNLNESIQPVSQQIGQQSRFQVKQDLDVLTDQIDSLPKVDKYQILLDEPIIENVQVEKENEENEA